MSELPLFAYLHPQKPTYNSLHPTPVLEPVSQVLGPMALIPHFRCTTKWRDVSPLLRAASFAVDRLTPFVGTRQLELLGPGHEFRPIFNGTSEAGPVDSVDAWHNGSHPSAAVLVTELLAGCREVLWNVGPQWQMQGPIKLPGPDLILVRPIGLRMQEARAWVGWG